MTKRDPIEQSKRVSRVAGRHRARMVATRGGDGLADRLTQIDARVGPERGSGYQPGRRRDTRTEAGVERTADEVQRIASAIADGKDVPSTPERALATQRAFQELVLQSARVQQRSAMTSTPVSHDRTEDRTEAQPHADNAVASNPIQPPRMDYSDATIPDYGTRLFDPTERHDAVDRVGDARLAAPSQDIPQMFAGEDGGHTRRLFGGNSGEQAGEPGAGQSPVQDETRVIPEAKVTWSQTRPQAMSLFAIGAFFACMIGVALAILEFSSDAPPGRDAFRAASADPVAPTQTQPSVTTIKTVPVTAPSPSSDTAPTDIAERAGSEASSAGERGVQSDGNKPAVIDAVSGRAFRLPTVIEGDGAARDVSRNGFIRLDQLPNGSRVSVGKRSKEGGWLVPERQADQILIIVTLPRIAKQASHDILAQHVGSDGVTPLSGLRTFRVAVSGSSSSAANDAALLPGDKPQTAGRVLSQDEVRRLLLAGNRLMRNGKVSKAREKFAEATLSELPEADLAMGQAYDAFYLAKVQSDVAPNENRARFWYRKAAEKGSQSAASKLERLGG